MSSNKLSFCCVISEPTTLIITCNISVSIFGYSSFHPTHINRVTLYGCTGDYTCRFMCLDAARYLAIKNTSWEPRDSMRICDVTEHRYWTQMRCGCMPTNMHTFKNQ